MRTLVNPCFGREPKVRVMTVPTHEWMKNSSDSPIAWSSSLLIRAFCLHCSEVGFFFTFLVVGFLERGHSTWHVFASTTVMFVFIVFLWFLLPISWFLPTFLMTKMVLLGGMESEPLVTLSFQVGNLPARLLPSHIGTLETVQARVKWPN